MSAQVVQLHATAKESRETLLEVRKRDAGRMRKQLEKANKLRMASEQTVRETTRQMYNEVRTWKVSLAAEALSITQYAVPTAS